MLGYYKTYISLFHLQLYLEITTKIHLNLLSMTELEREICQIDQKYADIM